MALFFTSTGTASVAQNTNVVTITGQDLTGVQPSMLLHLGARDRKKGDGLIIGSVTPNSNQTGGTLTLYGTVDTAYSNAPFVIDTGSYNGLGQILQVDADYQVLNALRSLTSPNTNLFSGDRMLALDKKLASNVSYLALSIGGRAWGRIEQRTLTYTPTGGSVTSVETAAFRAFPDGTTPTDAILIDLTTGGCDVQITSSTMVSAATTDLSSAPTGKVVITGSAAISSFGAGKHKVRELHFQDDGATIVYNATTLIVPGRANLVMRAGDMMRVTSDGSGNWRVRGVTRADGTPVSFNALRFDTAQTLTDAQAAQAAANGKLMLGDASNFGPTGFRNRFVNGELIIWQKGVSIANPANGAALADMVRLVTDGSGGTLTVSRPANGDDWLGGLRLNQSVAETGSTYRSIKIAIERASTLAGKRVVVSFTALHDPAQTDRNVAYVVMFQNFGSGGSPSDRVGCTAISSSLGPVTSTAKRFWAVFDVPSVAGKTFGTNGDDYLSAEIAAPINTTWDWTIRHIQVEEISATAPQRPTPPEIIGRALSLYRCKRYLQKTYDTDVTPGTANALTGSMTTITDATNSYPFIENMRFDPPLRTYPSITLYNPTSGSQTNPIRNLNAGTDLPAAINNPGTASAATLVSNSSVAGSSTLAVHLVADASYT